MDTSNKNVPPWERRDIETDQIFQDEQQEESNPTDQEREVQNDSWPDPDWSLINLPELEAPAFPLDVLGPFWAKWAGAAADGANGPVDFVAAGLLAIASALIGNARVAEASPTWREPPNIWVMNVGLPSSGKSPCLNELMTSAARLEGADPEGHRLIISDATIEAVAHIASRNPKGLCLYRDELSGWTSGFNKYGGDGDRQFWIEAYGGRRYTVDRKKHPSPITIPRLSVSVLGGTQPEKLRALLQTDADGLVARFIFAYPSPVRGFKLSEGHGYGPQMDAALQRLWRLAVPDDGPLPVRLSGEAATRFEEWWANKRDENHGQQGHYGDWVGKMGGTALRIALILTYLWWSADPDEQKPPASIEICAIEAAIELLDGWAAPMAQRAFSSGMNSNDEADAVALGRFLQRNQMVRFNARDVKRSTNRPFGLRDSARMTKAIATLEDGGFLRRIVRSGPGRQPLDYAVHPLLTGGG